MACILVAVVVSAVARAGLVAAQSGPGAIPLQPAPGIEGVIAAGTRPEVIATGLRGADDPIWLPNLGLVFSEPNANRIVRLTEANTLDTLVGDLHLPLGMTTDSQGRLISIQSEQGFIGIRVVWPRGQEALLADRFDGLPFSRPNGITVTRAGGLYFTDPGLKTTG
jgi:gluconolactonase